MKKCISGLMLIFMIASCEKEKQFEYRVDDTFEVYVDQFYEEAAKRGIAIPRNNLIIEFTNEPTNDFCGECRKAGNIEQSQRTIRIQNSNNCWKDRLDLNKETLIFHELGHCLLDREHMDEYYDDGSPKTIMTTFDDGPYSPCIYVLDGGNNADQAECNRANRRDFYLDELFGISPNFPFWLAK